ncbi:hypothetical protein JTF06_05825 [Desemzia sp. RIT804]|uniref:hypothetical protein n=1 Tax=Desemzia sp. RIT 804 TaxID=2810209 RepID=UPI00194DB88A|nr:hypothetical protein [Desemzia sp. RIT 804]MBM6614405.1 hypothetical protein [Desemzia sp. RIT 804]
MFRFRKQEYRSYLLLNEQTSKLCHQISIEQLILLNIALMSLFILYVFFHSQLFLFLSRIETSILVSQPTKIENTTIQSTSQSTSILDEHGFTRFHIRPFLISTKNERLFDLAIRHQFPIVVSFLNALSYCLIYFSNYVIFYVKKKNVF